MSEQRDAGEKTYRPGRRDFERLVLGALKSVPSQFRRRLRNVAIVVEDDPPDEPLLGLYEGVPLTERVSGEGWLPDRIIIYRRPIEALCQTRQELADEIRRTLLHEIGHYFGLSEEQLEGLEAAP